MGLNLHSVQSFYNYNSKVVDVVSIEMFIVCIQIKYICVCFFFSLVFPYSMVVFM